jgi:hypothetical protein
MTREELDKLLLDIQELKHSVKRANPFLRSVVALRAYAVMSIPLGVATLVFCLASHFLVQSYGSFAAIPPGWKTAFWIILAVLVLLSSALKWIVVGRRAAAIEKGANFWTAAKAIYGSSWVNINAAITLCTAVFVYFSIHIGHPWYIVPVIALCLGLVCNSIALAVERREYLVTGWFALASGLASLFFIEAAPFIWTAAVMGGIFFVYAASGLIYLPREEEEG